MSPPLFVSRNHENPNLACQRYVRLNEIDYSKCPVFDSGTTLCYLWKMNLYSYVSLYKRMTRARDGKKRIVWRCVSGLEFGTKYCHNSPTLDESRLHNAILAAMNEYAAIRQEVCPDVLAMVEEAKRAMSQAGAMLLELKKRMDEVSQEQSDVLDRLLANMADAELNARMKALTDEKEALKAQILKVQQKEVSMAEQAAKRQQMWDSLMECSAGYTEFDDEFVRQIIQKITVEDADTIRIHFRDSDVVLEQEVE